MAWNKSDDWKNALEPVGMTEFFRDTAIPDNIEGVLSDGNWEVIFHQYAQAEYAAENVDFLRAVRTFEISGDLNQAAEIYGEFVAEAAPRQVNLRGTVRTDLDEIFGPGEEGIGPPSVFDSARDEIIKMISVDTFPRFRASATKAQQELAEPVDWDNIEGRQRSAEVAAEPAPPAAPKRSIFAKKNEGQSEAEPPAAPEPTPAAEAAAPPPAEAEPVDVAQLKSSVDDLLQDPSTAVDAEAFEKLVAEPDFDQKLADATAALKDELGGEDDDDDDEDEDEDELEPAGES